MRDWLRSALALTLLCAASIASAEFHLFRIEQIYSNAGGTLQFVVLTTGSNGENLWSGHMLTSTHAGVPKASFEFPNNLPSNTGGHRVLIATTGFAALGLVTPDYVIPNGFLATDGGTLNYAGVDQVTYTSLPTNGISAIDRNGMVIPNVATNFAGLSASITAAQLAFTPAVGLWWNPKESGTGYNFDVKHGVLVVTVFTYEATGGHSEWYLAAGPIVNNVFTATLDKYRGGQCISCPYINPGPPVGNDGTMTITFTSAITGVVNLPGNRVTNIEPQVF